MNRPEVRGPRTWGKRPRPRTAGSPRLRFAVGLALVAVLGTPSHVTAHTAGPVPAGPVPGVPATPAGPPSAALTADPLRVAEGETVWFWLNVTPTDFASVAANLSLSLYLGDGLEDDERSPEIVAACPQPTVTEVVVAYSYHVTGAVSAWGSVSWGNGTNVTSEAVRIDVTSPAPTGVPTGTDWVVGEWSVLGAGAAALIRYRRSSRPPPALPLREV